ncbi:MAG TPA: isoprenylcysteine carboxylmethyltransferase family protein [Candidatus Limnocylindria bacterium]|nr:isoprenylcysteine carboxylmethyltransferase family protein [Candidatus Limnocylindria bacterium]
MELFRRTLLALAATALDALLLGTALGGIAPLLAHSRALALLAVWAAGTIALVWLKPVRKQDTVAVEPDPAFVLLSLFLLPLLSAPLAALGERLGVWPLPGGLGLRWLGVAMSGLGLAIRVAAMVQLGSRFSPLVAVQRQHELETQGLYGWVQHPGYLGSWLAALGGALAFDSALALPVVLAMAFLLRRRTAGEEALLERHFGDAYRAYRARTGRFLPRLIARADSRR